MQHGRPMSEPEQPKVKSPGEAQPAVQRPESASIRQPVFIISPPRSGSTMLYEALARSPSLHSIGGESHALIEQIEGLHPHFQNWSSNRLDRSHATAPIQQLLRERFIAALRDAAGTPAKGSVRMLEKTPKNSLRIPFLQAVFPDAQFIYLYRDPRPTLASMIEAWTSGRFRTYPRLPDWTDAPWSLLLVPGWRDLRALDLPEIVAHQWARTTTMLLDDLAAVPAARLHGVDYADLVADPASSIAKLCGSLDIVWPKPTEARLPLSPTVVSPPDPDKWRRYEAEIARVWPIIEEADARARLFNADLRAHSPS